MRLSKERRRWVLGVIVFLLWGGIVYRLVGVQLANARYYSRESARMHLSRLELLGERGKIYDRKGRLLTVNRLTGSILVLPQWARDLDTLAEIFAEFGLGDFQENRAVLRKFKRMFLFRRSIEQGVAKELRRVLTKRGFRNAVEIREDYTRYYPYGASCADVVGFVGAEGGLAGIEWAFDEVLRGEPGWILLQRDAFGYTHPYPSYPKREPVPGSDIFLTIDTDVSEICYSSLEKGVIRTGAKAGAVVVLDGRSGAILGLVDYPGYQPNEFADFPRERYKARAVSDEFEPGSSFKLVICAAALEDSNPARLTERMYDVSAGFIQIGNKKIKDVHPNGVLSFDSVFINSSNPACAMMSFEVSPELYYRIARELGFGEPTGIGLPDEARGRIDPPEGLRNRLRFANVAFGQGVTVTLLQLAAAYLCVANDGVFIRPYIIDSIRGRRLTLRAGGNFRKGGGTRQVLKRSTAQRIKSIFERVVTNGTGKLAAIPGVAVCGKTGTAQKVEPGGGYSSTRSVMSFIGFFPKDAPRYVIAVMVDEPKTARFAASAACPIFKEIGERLLALERADGIANGKWDIANGEWDMANGE